jgi:hypothetical protein
MRFVLCMNTHFRSASREARALLSNNPRIMKMNFFWWDF